MKSEKTHLLKQARWARGTAVVFLVVSTVCTGPDALADDSRTYLITSAIVAAVYWLSYIIDAIVVCSDSKPDNISVTLNSSAEDARRARDRIEGLLREPSHRG